MGQTKRNSNKGQPAGTYRKPKGSTLNPVNYSEDNTRLYYRLTKRGKTILIGFFDFVNELFYISKIVSFDNGDIDLLYRELRKLDYEYAGNADNYFYQAWLEKYTILNNGNKHISSSSTALDILETSPFYRGNRRAG